MQNSLIAVQSAVEPKDAAVVVRTPAKKVYTTLLLILLIIPVL